MDPKTAVEVIKQYTNNLQMSRRDHDTLWTAIVTIEKELVPEDQRMAKSAPQSKIASEYLEETKHRNDPNLKPHERRNSEE